MNQNEGLMQDASNENGEGMAKLKVIKQHLSAVQQKKYVLAVYQSVLQGGNKIQCNN